MKCPGDAAVDAFTPSTGLRVHVKAQILAISPAIAETIRDEFPEVITPGGPRSASLVLQVIPHGSSDQTPLGQKVAPTATRTSDLVVTPGGPRHQSLVHKGLKS